MYITNISITGDSDLTTY